MRRVILAIASTITGLVLLLSFKTQAQPALAVAVPARASTSTTSTTSGSDRGTSGTGTTSTGSTSGTASLGSGSTAAKTYTGAETETRYGPVTVQITVAGGKVTAATATEYPEDNPRDAQINAYAVPTLNSETVAASSANIDTVSGATYTSDGYLTSLQSALDQAGLS